MFFKNKKLEVKIVDEKKENTYVPAQTRPTAQEVEAAKQVLVGGAVLFLTKLVIEAGTEIAVASIKAK